MLGATKKLIENLEKQIADERTMHAEERTRILAENTRLQQECERLRLALNQPSRALEVPMEGKAPPVKDPDEMPDFQGTPWTRVQQREIWLQTPAGKRWEAKQLAEVRELLPKIEAVQKETH